MTHQVNTELIAVFIEDIGGVMGIFSRVVDGKTLTFEHQQDSQDFVDWETSSVWDAVGWAKGSPVSGVELIRLNTRR